MKTQEELEQEHAIKLLQAGLFTALAANIDPDNVRDIVESMIVEDVVRRAGIAEREALLAKYEQGPRLRYAA